MDPLYDPRAPEFQADPYPIYARMRESGPVHFRVFEQPDGREVPVEVLGEGRFLRGAHSSGTFDDDAMQNHHHSVSHTAETINGGPGYGFNPSSYSPRSNTTSFNSSTCFS